MADRQFFTAGEMLAQSEGSIGTALRSAVKDYYNGRDLDTAQTIRSAQSDTEASQVVRAMRQGRVIDVVMVAGMAGAGVVAGALLQKMLGNPSVAGISPVGALGLVTTIAGLVAPIGLPGRAALAAGGLAYMAGATLYNQVAPAAQGTP
jgi:ABC-type enterochelin transport system permease subunit